MISTSASFGLVGTPYSGGDRPLTCPAICCFAFWPTGFKPISLGDLDGESQRLLDRSTIS